MFGLPKVLGLCHRCRQSQHLSRSWWRRSQTATPKQRFYSLECVKHAVIPSKEPLATWDLGRGRLLKAALLLWFSPSFWGPWCPLSRRARDQVLDCDNTFRHAEWCSMSLCSRSEGTLLKVLPLLHPRIGPECPGSSREPKWNSSAKYIHLYWLIKIDFSSIPQN